MIVVIPWLTCCMPQVAPSSEPPALDVYGHRCIHMSHALMHYIWCAAGRRQRLAKQRGQPSRKGSEDVFDPTRFVARTQTVEPQRCTLTLVALDTAMMRNYYVCRCFRHPALRTPLHDGSRHETVLLRGWNARACSVHGPEVYWEPIHLPLRSCPFIRSP